MCRRWGDNSFRGYPDFPKNIFTGLWAGGFSLKKSLYALNFSPSQTAYMNDHEWRFKIRSEIFQVVWELLMKDNAEISRHTGEAHM